jgi:hypothetical protein
MHLVHDRVRRSLGPSFRSDRQSIALVSPSSRPPVRTSQSRPTAHSIMPPRADGRHPIGHLLRTRDGPYAYAFLRGHRSYFEIAK